MTQQNTYYCYVLLDPRKPGLFSYGSNLIFKFEPFYVGKGKGRRSKEHAREAFRAGVANSYKTNKIKKIISSGYEVRYKHTTKTLSEKEALDLERVLIKAIGRIDLKTGPLCNLSTGGEYPTAGPLTGKKISAAKKGVPIHSEEEKKRISERLTGRPVSQKTREKMRLSQVGKSHSEETRKRISLAKQNPSDETREKISLAGTGRKHSAETCAKRNASISASRTPELRARISAALKGRPKGPMSPEHRAKISAAKRNISDETREKMRQSKLGNKNRLGGTKLKAKS